MSNEEQDAEPLFDYILRGLRTPEQVAYWHYGEVPETYTLLRDPINLQEVTDFVDDAVAIWGRNDTLTYVSRGDVPRFPVDCRVALNVTFKDTCFTFQFIGKTVAAVLETATYYLGLKEPTDESFCIDFVASRYFFEFSLAPAQCLKKLFETAPSCHVRFENMFLSAEQSTVLATRPHPSQLTLSDCDFEDAGNAFIEALENRKVSIGSLTFDGACALRNNNLKRLLENNKIDHLKMSALEDDDALLPLSAKVDSLDYGIFSNMLLLDEFQSSDIFTNKLSLAINHDDETFPTEPVLSFFRRVAELGLFEELKLEIVFDEEGRNTPVPVLECVVQELIRATLANRNLKVLHLGAHHRKLDWDSHLWKLFEGLKDHKALRILRFDIADEDEVFEDGYFCIEMFLSKKRNITVTNSAGEIYTDWHHVDKLYALNRFYCGSAELVFKPPSERSLLVATALEKSARYSFQRSALLLSDHADALCELVQSAQLDELDEDGLLLRWTPDWKRQRRW